MTDIEPEAITDEQVSEFFDSGGVLPESKKEAAPEDKPVDEKAEASPAEEPKEEKKVNYGALHEERMRRKEAAERAKEAAERAKKAEEEAAELRKQLERFANSNDNSSEDDDPLTAVARRQEMVERVLAAQAQQAIRQSEEAKYWQRINASEAAFRQDQPDFDDAVKFLAETRKAELMAIGWDEAGAQKILGDEIRWIADKAYADEVNPAERFYTLATHRGYKKAEAAPVVQPAPQDDKATAKLDTIARGIQTNKNLPPASKSVKTDLTAEAVADMNIDALSNLYGQTDFDKAWNKLFGNAS